MIYLVSEIASLIFSYKIIHIHIFYGSSASLIFPLTYTWNDIITEVYGIKKSIQTIIYIFMCDIVFVIIVTPIVYIPTSNPIDNLSYLAVLSKLYRALSAEITGVLIGAIINSIIISRWKIITKGSGFWYRSILSSCLGEIIMLIISVPIAMAGIVSPRNILSIIYYAMIYKVIFATLISGPAQIASNVLKSTEGIDVFDFNSSINPFKKHQLQQKIQE